MTSSDVNNGSHLLRTLKARSGAQATEPPLLLVATVKLRIRLAKSHFRKETSAMPSPVLNCVRSTIHTRPGTALASPPLAESGSWPRPGPDRWYAPDTKPSELHIEHAADDVQKPSIGLLSCRGWPGRSGVVGARSHHPDVMSKDGTDRFDPHAPLYAPTYAMAT